MSFSQIVKKEIFNNVKKIKGCCATSFLTAVLKAIGSLCVDAGGYCFSAETENGDLLLLCSRLAQSEFGVNSDVFQINNASDGVDKNARFVGKFDVALGDALHLVSRDEENALRITQIPKVNLKSDCCRRAFMQALFLCCGSTTIPEDTGDAFAESAHSNYHLELRFSNADFANFVQKEFFELEFRQTQRKNSVMLYLKDSNKIADFFVFVDAVNAKFTVENVIIGRSFRNTANRQRNCIDSNLDKAALAGAKQLAAIEKIRKQGKFDSLPQNLQEVALLREQNREANLAELAAALHISKSGVNHRLNKLLEIAQEP